MSNELTPKKMELTDRQHKVLDHVLKREKHEDIARKLKIGVTTLYKDLKAIKEQCGIIPEEIIAETALVMIRQLRLKLEMTWKDLEDSADEWGKFKEFLAKDRTKAEQKKWESLDFKEQGTIIEFQLDKLQRLEDTYVRMQMQHSFAMRDIIQFKKAVGVYNPDVIIDQSQHGNTLNVFFTEGMKDNNSQSKDQAQPKKKERTVN